MGVTNAGSTEAKSGITTTQMKSPFESNVKTTTTNNTDSITIARTFTDKATLYLPMKRTILGMDL